MAKRGKRGLTDEDRNLWKKVADTANPMDRRGVASTSETNTPVMGQIFNPEPVQKPAQIPAFRVGEKASTLPRPIPKKPVPPLRMDHNTSKRLVRGKLKPEGRIDLHGMTLAEAHPALMSFLFEASQAQKRLVLVITGKGKDRDTGGPIPIRRGILRNQVPMWMANAPLNGLILDVREAHQRHGGSGAYYVYLRRRR